MSLYKSMKFYDKKNRSDIIPFQSFFNLNKTVKICDNRWRLYCCRLAIKYGQRNVMVFEARIELVNGLSERTQFDFRSSTRITSTHTTRWKQKPVHENAFAVVVRIVGEQAMPFILLFTTTIVTATTCFAFPAWKKMKYSLENAYRKAMQLIRTCIVLGEWLVRNVVCSRSLVFYPLSSTPSMEWLFQFSFRTHQVCSKRIESKEFNRKFEWHWSWLHDSLVGFRFGRWIQYWSIWTRIGLPFATPFTEIRITVWSRYIKCTGCISLFLRGILLWLLIRLGRSMEIRCLKVPVHSPYQRFIFIDEFFDAITAIDKSTTQ